MLTVLFVIVFLAASVRPFIRFACIFSSEILQISGAFGVLD